MSRQKVSYEAVVKLQSYEPDYVKAWTLICDVSSKGRSRVSLSSCSVIGVNRYGSLGETRLDIGVSTLHLLL